ncbi:T9SS type A sorting domain-containing protein [Flavisolibacter sp. BT320]|nr:T9SS type A sorting domain-containing protein [Flavisolibacter longurius]
MKRLLTLVCFVMAVVVHLSAQPVLYGATQSTISRYNVATNSLTAVLILPNDGNYPADQKLVETPTGKIYGVTTRGGKEDRGTVFSYNPSTDTYVKESDFSQGKGQNPHGNLTIGSDGKLYGPSSDFFNVRGVVYSFNPLTHRIEIAAGFGGWNGAGPVGGLLLTKDGKMYGMTAGGGCMAQGAIYYFNGTSAEPVSCFGSAEGWNPIGILLEATDGMLYGMTSAGGTNNRGVIFSFDPESQIRTKLKDLSGSDGANPEGSLMQASNGMLYGMTSSGGVHNLGVIFSFDPATGTYTKLKDFAGPDGATPQGSLMQANNGMLYGMTSSGGTNNLGVVFSYDPATGTYAKLKDFAGSDGANPEGSLMQASNGMLYAVTKYGGNYSLGVLFSLDPVSNIYRKIRDFEMVNGLMTSSITKASNGLLYGMTNNGGATKEGVLFSYDPASGVYEKLKDLDSANGKDPYSGMTEFTNKKMYGLMQQGGASNLGVVFSYDPATGTYAKLKDFTGPDGANPMSEFAQGPLGKLYGLTPKGGANNLGVIFSYDPASGTYTKLKDFTGPDGANPEGSLVLAHDGLLYGVTRIGGATNKGVIFSFDPSTATYIKLYDADNYPTGKLVQADNGKLYGGAGNIIFSFDPKTKEVVNVKTLTYDEGWTPRGSLVRASDGKLYGMASGGNFNRGVLFSIDASTNTYTKLEDFTGQNGESRVSSFSTLPWNSSLVELSRCPASAASIVVTTSGSSSSGLSYKYYEGSWTVLPDFGGLTPVASGKVQNVTLSPRMRDDRFAFLFEGQITIPKAGRYYFETTSDDGSRLYIGNYGHYITPVVDNDGQHGLQTRGGWYTFPAPGQYPIAVSYFEQGGEEQLHLYWGSADAGIPMHTPIPDHAFEPPAYTTSTLTYAYYEGTWDKLPDFGGLTPVERGQVSNIDLSRRKRDEQFAFLFEGRITIPSAGWYYFETLSDDGSKLYIGNYGHYVTPVVDNDGQHAALLRGGWYHFPAAGQYPFALSFFEQSGEQQMKLFWGSNDAGIPMHTQIPDEAFQQGVAPCGNVILTASEGDSYLWNSGDTTRSVVVTQNGSYSVTVTKEGCSATSELTVITCTDNSITNTTSTVKESAALTKTVASEKLSVKALPNPSASHFTLQLSGAKSSERITLRMLDVVGRVVETRTLAAGTAVQVGHTLRPGIYFAEVVQGVEKLTLKLVKTTD